jgi:hypothetical protein
VLNEHVTGTEADDVFTGIILQVAKESVFFDSLVVATGSLTSAASTALLNRSLRANVTDAGPAVRD